MTNENLIIHLSSGAQINLVYVQGGEFMMGDDNGKDEDEKPAHRVQVDSFWIGRFPVTQRLWQEVMGNNPATLKGKRRPVEQVSWDDAQEFIQKLNARWEFHVFIQQIKLPDAAFRLPTEAEWEYAARGGAYSQGYKYAGSDRAKQVAWHIENSGRETHDVGLLLENKGVYRVLRGGGSLSAGKGSPAASILFSVWLVVLCGCNE